MADFGFFALGFGGWVAALVLPPTLAVWFWNSAPRYLGAWLPALLFLPTVLTAEWALVRLLFFAAHDDGEGPPGLGLALIPAAALLAVTVAVFYLGVAARVVHALYVRFANYRRG